QISLPGTAEDYRQVLLLGAIGAGKTTLLRQLIGTGDRHERFPSTSTARTTIADTEVVLDDGPYRAVVTFFSMEEVRDHLVECVAAAVLAAHRGAQDDEVLTRLLNHPEQRFRFSYVLGAGPGVDSEPDEDDDEDAEDDQVDAEPGFGAMNQDATNELLAEAVS